MSDKPTIAELIRQHALEITDSMELYRLIQRHHPSVTPKQLSAELRRVGAEEHAKADALERYGNLRRQQANDI